MNVSRPLARYPWARWAVPVTVAAVAVGGTALFTQVTADAAVVLPARGAAQLLVDVQSARQITGSGTVVQKADLGLPQLPSIGGAGSSSLSSLIAGSHTLRVWYGGPDRARVALMGTLGESDVIRNGRDLWTWSSDSNSATHRLLPTETAAEKAAGTPARTPADALTPQQLADQALAAITPTTSVSTDGTARVAGRSAYELVLTPKDTASLIGPVRIAVDAQRHVPLRVQVFARNATTAAVEVGFTQISFSPPSAAQFHFSPPPGVTLTEQTSQPDPAGARSAETAAQPSVTGQGWTSVIQAQLTADASSMLRGDRSGARPDGSTAQLQRVMRVLPKVSGSWGSGRLLHSSLFTVLLTDDGRVLAGAVPAARLYQLAGQPLPAAGS